MRVPENIRFRGGVLARKLTGRLPGVAWRDVFDVVSTSGNILLENAKVLEHDPQFNISLVVEPGEEPIWFPVASPDERDGDEIWLSRIDYYHHEYIGHLISPGEVLFDCGGYAGTFTKWAFKHGAAMAVVFEPDVRSVECIRRNLAKEMADGRVVLKHAGCWNQAGHLELAMAEQANASTFNTALVKTNGSGIQVPVVTLDEVADELGLARLDLIKMDIEGAERQALQGSRQILSRFAPRLVICTYHLRDDRRVLPALVRESGAPYLSRRRHAPGRKVDVWY